MPVLGRCSFRLVRPSTEKFPEELSFFRQGSGLEGCPSRPRALGVPDRCGRRGETQRTTEATCSERGKQLAQRRAVKDSVRLHTSKDVAMESVRVYSCRGLSSLSLSLACCLPARGPCPCPCRYFQDDLLRARYAREGARASPADSSDPALARSPSSVGISVEPPLARSSYPHHCLAA